MAPLDCVLVLGTGKYQGSAGVVEKVERDEKGQEVAAVVDMDIDHKRVRLPVSEVRVIKAN